MLTSVRWLWLCVVATLLVLPISQAVATPQNDPILTEIATYGHGSIRQSEWSEDGEMLAVYINDELRIYKNGEPDPLVIPYPKKIHSMEFRQDNGMLAVADQSGVRLLDSRNGGILVEKNIRGTGGFQFIAGQPYILLYPIWDGGDADIIQTVMVWDYLDNVEIHRMDFQNYPWPSPVLYSGHFIVGASRSAQNGSGSTIASLTVDDLLTGERRLHSVKLRPFFVSLLANPDNPDHIATLDDGGVVRFWNIRTGTELLALSLPYDLVNAIAFSPDGTQLATAGTDGKVRLWNTETGDLLEVYSGQRVDIVKLSIMADGQIRAFSNPDVLAQVWDARTGDIIAAYDALHTPTVSDISFDSHNQKIIGVTDNSLIRWDIDSGEQTARRWENGQLHHGIINPAGTLVASYDNDIRTIVFKSLQVGATGFSYQLETNTFIRHMQWMPDGSGLLICAQQTLPFISFRIQYLELSGSAVKALLDDSVTDMAHDAPSPMLVFSDYRSFFQDQLADEQSDSTTSDDPLSCPTLLSPHNQFLVTVEGYDRSTVRVWDTGVWQRRWEREVIHSMNTPAKIAIHPDNSLIAIAMDHKLIIFDAETGDPLDAIDLDNDYITAMRFNADGTQLVTAGEDGYVKLWSVR